MLFEDYNYQSFFPEVIDAIKGNNYYTQLITETGSTRTSEY